MSSKLHLSLLKSENPLDNQFNDKNSNEELVIQLRKLMKETSQLRNLPSDDDYLLRFLYSCNFDVEASFQRMKYYHELLVEFPDWFQKEGPLKRKSLIEKEIRIMTDRRDREGRPIYLVKIGNMDASTMNMLDIVNIDDIWLEYISADKGLKENGLSVIVDIKNFSLKLMKWMTPHNLRVGIKKLEAHPVKEYKIHVVNSSFFINVPIKLLWPFLPEKIKNMIKFHFDDWSSLHEHISPEVLPEEYGGLCNFNFKDDCTKLFVKNNEIIHNFNTYRNVNATIC